MAIPSYRGHGQSAEGLSGQREIELGDSLEPCFTRFFTGDEMRMELESAGSTWSNSRSGNSRATSPTQSDGHARGRTLGTVTWSASLRGAQYGRHPGGRVSPVEMRQASFGDALHATMRRPRTTQCCSPALVLNTTLPTPSA